MLEEITTAGATAVAQALPLLLLLLLGAVLALGLERAGARLAPRMRRLVSHALVALAIAAGLYFAWQVLFLSDDAFISFRYAKNLAAGRGLVFNEGEWVEGYTNFLWTALLGFCAWLGADIPKIALVGNALAFVGTLLVCAALVRRLAPRRPIVPFAVIALAAAQPFYTFASSGLETMPAALLVIAALALSTRPKHGSLYAGVLLTGATLMRPDHLVFYFAFGLAAVVEDLIHGDAPRLLRRLAWRRYLACAAPLVLVYVPYFLLRWHAYGDPFPNTFYAKSGGSAHGAQGLAWVLHFIVSSGAWAWLPLFAVALRARARARGETRARLFALVSAALFIPYVISLGGDFMEYRFFVPLLPLVAVATELGVRDLAGGTARRAVRFAVAGASALALAAALLPVRLIEPRVIRWGIAMEPSFYRVTSLSPLRIACPWFDLGQRLHRVLTERGVTPTLAVGAAGLLGYYSELPLIDAFGLTSRAIAHKPVGHRGRPGHEKVAGPEELVALGAVLDVNHRFDGAFRPVTTLRVDGVELHFLHFDPVVEQALRALPRTSVPDPEAAAEAFAATSPRVRVLAARRFFAGYLEGHPSRARVLARLEERLYAVADFEDGWPAAAVVAGDAFTVARGRPRPLGASGDGWLTSRAPGTRTGMGRVVLPLGVLEAEELRFVIGGAVSDALTVSLVVEGETVEVAHPSGPDLVPVAWDLERHQGGSAVLVVEDADPAADAGFFVDAIHFAPSAGDVRERIASYDPRAPEGVAELLGDAEALLPRGDPDRRALEAHIGWRYDFSALPDGSSIEGTAFGAGPVPGPVGDQQSVDGTAGAFLDSYHDGDDSEGRVALPEMVLPAAPISLLVGGGKRCNELYVGLEVDGAIIAKACGADDSTLRPRRLAPGRHAGKRGRIVIVDRAKGPWGHILVDEIVVPRAASRATTDAVRASVPALPRVPHNVGARLTN